MFFICIYVNGATFCIVFLTYMGNFGSLRLLYTILLILDHEKYIFESRLFFPHDPRARC